MNINFNKASYRSLARNDENSWSAHKIPMSTLTRFPYPQYHSSKDNISIISKKSLLVCYSALKQTINFIEKTKFIEKRFQGIVCLSNPKYNLYTNDGEPAFGKKISLKSKKIRKIIDLIPLLEKPTSIDYISSIIDLDKKTILQYLKKWKEKKLIAIL